MAATMASPSRAGVMMASWSDGRGLVDPPRQIGHEPVDLLGLRGRERDGPDGLVGNRRRPWR